MLYKILQKCTIQGRFLEPGNEIDTDLMPVYSEIVMDGAVTLGQAEKVQKPHIEKSVKKEVQNELPKKEQA